MKFKCSACSYEETITNVSDFKRKYVRDGFGHCPMCNHPHKIKSSKPKPPPMPPEPAEPAELVAVAELADEPATKTCPDCAEEVKFMAAKCRFCNYLFVERPPAASKALEFEVMGLKTSPIGIVGAIIIFVGMLVTLYFFVDYDTTVSTGYGNKRVHNIGLQQDRTLGCAVGMVAFVVGLILVVVDYSKSSGKY